MTKITKLVNITTNKNKINLDMRMKNNNGRTLMKKSKPSSKPDWFNSTLAQSNFRPTQHPMRQLG